MSDSAAAAPVTFFKRSSKGASKFRKRAPTPPPAASDSDTSDNSDNDTPAGRPIKKRKTGTAAVTASSSSAVPNPIKDTTTVGPTYSAASRDIVSDVAAEATKANFYEELNKGLPSRRRGAGDEEDDGTYKGAAAYGSFIKKNPDAAAKHVGPLKAATNVRTITVTDYAPDVCKDYKQTGFCGFGDTCKFLHAREDYAAGWKLDRDWEIGKNGKRKEGEKEDDDDEWKELKDIPFKCVICKGDYKDPVITKCGHYFCEGCAIKRYKKNPGCVICGKRTDGVFNVARGLRKKLERKTEREEEKRKKEEEEKAEEEKNKGR